MCRLTVFLLVFCLGIDPVILAAPVSARAGISFPEPTAMIQPSAAFVPAVMRGLQFDTENPFEFNFIIDTGENDIEGPALEEESGRLIRYFLAALTVPEKDLWVNLVPREEQRIITPELGVTLMGRDMLAQDYLLKQFASSLMYPDGEVGRKFWERVYKRAQQQFGTTDIPLGSFNKVWIVPAEAKVFENENGAYVIGTRLKVMLEDEYARASDLVGESPAGSGGNSIANALVKEILIPEIEREVNEGEHFARLRQIYHSLILATWYKRTLKDSILTQQYADHNKVSGVDEIQPGATDEIYDQYMQAVRKGVYNFIKEDYDPATHETVPRKYMSGGLQIVPEVDQATLAEMMSYLRSAEARQWRWKKVRTELRRPKEWGSQFLKEGPYPEPPLVLTGKDQEIYRQANGRPRPMDADEVGRLLQRITRSEKIRFIRRDLGPYTVSTGIAVTEEGMQYRMLNVGHLFLMDNRFYYFMDPELRRELGQNVILLERFDSLEVVRRGQDMYAAAAIVSMLQRQDWENYTVVDVGAGVGVLSLVAHKLGARYVELIENLPRKVEQAKIQMQLNGLKLGPDYDVHQIDLSDAKQVRRTVSVIGQRRDEKDPGRRFAIVSNIGYWPKVRERGVQVYSASNQNSMDLMEGLNGVNLFIGSGYNVTTDLKNLEATAPDMNRLEDLGFEIPEAALVKLPDREPIISLTAVRPDAAIFGKPGKLQDWLRRSRGEQKRRGEQPAWGRAKDLTPRQSEALMDRFRADPKLIILRWDGELSPGQPYGQFELDGRLWVRENAYIRRVNGPGDLVIVRLGPLMLMDRTFYLELDDTVKEELGSNVVLISRLNNSSLNSTLFHIYNSSTALSMIAQGSYDDHHVIDVGSGDGILALIAHKLGAKYSELIEADAYSLMRASHQLILNGMDPDTDFSVHLGDITDEEFVRKETAFMIANMEKHGADALSVVANIGQWDDYYGKVNNRTVIGLLNGLPPVDRLVLGGYDVTSVSRNKEVVDPDREALAARGHKVSEMQLRYAGNPMTVAMVATAADSALIAQVEMDLQDALKLDEERLESGVVSVNGRDIAVTQYRNRQFEEVPYFRVGEFLVINSGIADYLPASQRTQLEANPGVIFLDQEEFTDAFAYERWEGYGGFTLAVMAAMQAFREKIDGHTFVDFGAGSGVLSIIASRLGAREVIAIEGREEALPILARNLAANNIPNVRQFQQMIESIDALELSPQPVFALNLPYFGLLLGSGERAVTLLKALELVADPAVAIVSGGSFGRGSIDDAVIRILEQRGADVIESTLIKRHVSEPDLAVSNVFSGVFETKILRTTDADRAMFGKSARRKLFERLLGLVDRYTDRIPPQFAASPEPVVSLTQNNPYFHDFLGSLDIDVTIPPRLQQQGFWRYELDLDQPQRRRLMDLLSKHSHVPDRDMPKKWSVIFYKGEPLLLVMEGLRWNSFSEGMRNSLLDQHASYLFGKGITEAGMRMYIDGLAQLKWSRAISLIPVNSERVSLTDRMHLALLAKWTDATSDGPVIVADTLFDLTPIPGVSTRVVTSWGSYDARSMESTMFRVGIHPRPGELIYLLGTGMGADALYTAERTGGDVRIVATDIDPYLLGNARSNIAASPYAGSIRLVQADLFDFATEDTEKADRILFNIPLDSQITGRNRDSRTSDPGMKLLNRLLTEAKDHLKEGGTLEVNYMTRPSFFAAVYKAGWEVAEVSGQDIFNQLENANMQAFQYLRFVLKRQDPAHAEQNAKALSDLEALARMERPLMMALATQEGQRRGSSGLSQRKREEFRQGARSILRDWVDEGGITPSIVRSAADGVGWMAKSDLRLGSRYKHPDRLAEPYFTLEPNPMSVMGRIEDMSMLAADTKLIETDWPGYWADHLRRYFGRDRVTEDELVRYRAIEAIISDDVKYALLRDRALQPVFMQIMPDGFVGELETNDVVDAKLAALIDGRPLREYVEEYSAFRVGRLETAAKVIAAGGKIVVGVTDRSHDLTMGIRARIANGRQTYFPLPDGSWLGVKGSGYNYAYLGAAEKSPLMFTDRVSYGLFPRYQAIRQLDIFNVLGVNQQGFADFLGVRRLQMLPDGEGRFESVNLYLDNHPERDDAWPYLSFHRVSSPHRLVSFGQLLSTPGSLSFHMERIAHLMGRDEYGVEEMLLDTAYGLGVAEAEKQNHELYHTTINEQDYVLGGYVADTGELVGNTSVDSSRNALGTHAEVVLRIKQVGRVLMGLSRLTVFTLRYGDANEQLPARPDLLKSFFDGYLSTLSPHQLERLNVPEGLFYTLFHETLMQLPLFVFHDGFNPDSELLLRLTDGRGEELEGIMQSADARVADLARMNQELSEEIDAMVVEEMQDRAVLASADPAVPDKVLQSMDQAQLATSVYAWSIREEVRRHWKEARLSGEDLHAPEVAEQVLAGYALTPGQLLPRKDRTDDTTLGVELSRRMLSLPLTERLTILEILERVNTRADQLSRRKETVQYPQRVDYRFIGELFTRRRGDMTRKDAAAGIGIGQGTIKKIEEWSLLEGEARYQAGLSANLETLLKFMNFYRIHVDELFGRNPPAPTFAPYVAEYVGPNIKIHRDRQGLTIDEMADRLGMNRANYDRLEGGGYNPTFEVLVKVASALGVSLDYLLRPNLVLEHEPRRVAYVEQWAEVRDRYSQEAVRLRLRNLRARRGLSVQQVADAIGRPASYVGLMENARDKTFFIQRVKRMADFYGVSLFYLVTGLRTTSEEGSIGKAEIRSDWLRRNIRMVREHRGLQRRDVDRLAGIPLDVVQRVEREGEPLFDYFVKISVALQVPMSLLLSDPQQVEAYLLQEVGKADGAGAAPSTNTRSGTDAAVFSEAPGGIDFRADRLELDVERAGSDPVQFDLKNPQDVQIDGLVPVIINITPVTSIPLLLGFHEPVSPPLAEGTSGKDPAADPRERMIAALNAV